ncbi:MAG: M23 family metallopeptidase [bacterium]|nr:M23 family metallopeptidase [bacterium]
MKRRIAGLAIWLFLSSFSLSYADLFNFKTSTFQPYQSDVIRLEMAKAKKIKTLKNGKKVISYATEGNFKVIVFGKEYLPIDCGNKLVVFVGVDYQKKPGFYPLEVIVKQNNFSFRLPIMKLTVRQKYPKLRYQPPKRTKEEQEKINKESEKINNVLISTAGYSVKELSGFRWPIVPVKVTAPFGQARCQDKKKTSCRYHTGTDFRSAFDEYHSNPENVFPINNGLVVEVSTYTLEGITIVVDHGAGLKSSYFHLSRAYYKKGDVVSKAKSIARSGATGTDAVHLHLMMTIYGATVDPEKFLKSVIKK